MAFFKSDKDVRIEHLSKNAGYIGRGSRCLFLLYNKER